MNTDKQGNDNAGIQVGATASQEYDFSAKEIPCFAAGILLIIHVMYHVATVAQGEYFRTHPVEVVWCGIFLAATAFLGVSLFFPSVKKNILIKTAIFAAFGISIVTDVRFLVGDATSGMDNAFVLWVMLPNLLRAIIYLIFAISLVEFFKKLAFRILACFLLIALQLFSFFCDSYYFFNRGEFPSLDFKMVFFFFSFALFNLGLGLIAFAFLPSKKKCQQDNNNSGATFNMPRLVSVGEFKTLTMMTQALIILGMIIGICLDFIPAPQNTDAVTNLSFIRIALLGVPGIAFLSWVYRANKNLHALGVQDMRFSPGGSVGWWFVPIASLWKPFQIMAEIFSTSRRLAARDSGIALIGFWWGITLGSLLLSQIMVFAPKEKALTYVASGIEVVIAILQIIIIEKITSAQSQFAFSPGSTQRKPL